MSQELISYYNKVTKLARVFFQNETMNRKIFVDYILKASSRFFYERQDVLDGFIRHNMSGSTTHVKQDLHNPITDETIKATTEVMNAAIGLCRNYNDVGGLEECFLMDFPDYILNHDTSKILYVYPMNTAHIRGTHPLILKVINIYLYLQESGKVHTNIHTNTEAFHEHVENNGPIPSELILVGFLCSFVREIEDRISKGDNSLDSDNISMLYEINADSDIMQALDVMTRRKKSARSAYSGLSALHEITADVKTIVAVLDVPDRQSIALGLFKEAVSNLSIDSDDLQHYISINFPNTLERYGVTQIKYHQINDITKYCEAHISLNLRANRDIIKTRIATSV